MSTSTAYEVELQDSYGDWRRNTSTYETQDEAMAAARDIAKSHHTTTRVNRLTFTATERVRTVVHTAIIEFRVTVSVEEVRFEPAGDAQ